MDFILKFLQEIFLIHEINIHHIIKRIYKDWNYGET